LGSLQFGDVTLIQVPLKSCLAVSLGEIAKSRLDKVYRQTNLLEIILHTYTHTHTHTHTHTNNKPNTTKPPFQELVFWEECFLT
jgi:hypothetical protein